VQQIDRAAYTCVGGNKEDETAPDEDKKGLVELLGQGPWIPDDDVPIGYPFSYEKDIIEEFVAGNGLLVSDHRVEAGCTMWWPEPAMETAAEDESAKVSFHLNPVSEETIGTYRPHDARIIVDTRSKYHDPASETDRRCLARCALTFCEAGPRQHLYFPRGKALNVAVLVSGGIAPGINAVIAGIYERHHLYKRERDSVDKTQARGGAGRKGQPKTERERKGATAQDYGPSYDLSVYGVRDGFAGLSRGELRELTEQDIREHANLGGSMIGTSRFDSLLDTENPHKRHEALEDVVRNLSAYNVHILYIIGGDGSMRAAHAIWTLARQIGRPVSVIAIPKTMDNDVLWVWQAFGFLSAVEKAREFVLQLQTEARSNPRLCIVQLFGSDSGFVVSHAALASGVNEACDCALIPEVDFTMRELSRYIIRRLDERYKPGREGRSPYGMIVMAETAIPKDVQKFLNSPKYADEIGLEQRERDAVDKFLRESRRVHGQTPDELRRAGLKIVSRVLQADIRSQTDPYWKTFRVFTNEPRHLLRAINPSVQDVIMAQRLGCLAVDNAMAGYSDFMISQWLTEYVLVPLKLVILGRKRVPQKGIFWKSVIANTRQPADMGDC